MDTGIDPGDPDAIRAEINRTREDMGETLDALGEKLDVRSRAKNKVQAREQAQSFYRRQPAAVVAGTGALVALLAALLVRRARR